MHFFKINVFKTTSTVRIPSCKKLKENKKKWTPHRFLHRGPKKAVEHDSDIHFDLTWAKKKEMFFCAKNSYLSLKNGVKWNILDFFFTET